MQPFRFNLSVLKHYNSALIYNWLCLQKTNSFIIEIDWETYDDIDDHLQYVFNYTSVAYAGEMLCKCAKAIHYNAPLPLQQPFHFLLTDCNKKKLAKKLAPVVAGFFADDETMTNFSIRSNLHFIHVLEGKKITHLPALIHLADQYLS